jgi:asparaginyl-tRNA synthetase
MRVRSVLSFAVHSYFQEKVCICKYANNTGSDAEGAGEMFKVTLYHLTERQEPRTEK